MKRVVKLTESQLEMIVKRVIEEQQAPSESTGLWKDDEGITYKFLYDDLFPLQEWSILHL